MSLAIISGGTATNSLISAFDSVSSHISFILPTSDNGGSSAEIQRFFGGPAIGDIRSRITHLITLKQTCAQQHTKNQSLGSFFNYRLAIDKEMAQNEWENVLNGTHKVCTLLGDRKNEILSLLKSLQCEIKHKNGHFNFQNASLGNLYMLSLRLKFHYDLYKCSETFVSLVGVGEKYKVIPALNDQTQDHIAAELDNGEIIKGQSQISHPSERRQLTIKGEVDLGTLDLDQHQLIFHKMHTVPLPSPINRIYYIDNHRNEQKYQLFDVAYDALASADAVVYSIGSLFTSIVPVLVLQNTASAILQVSKKVFLLNGNQDRETLNMTVFDYLLKVLEALMYSLGRKSKKITLKNSFERLVEYEKAVLRPQNLAITSFFTHICVLDRCNVEYNIECLEKLGIECVVIKSVVDEVFKYDLTDFETKMRMILES